MSSSNKCNTNSLSITSFGLSTADLKLSNFNVLNWSILPIAHSVPIGLFDLSAEFSLATLYICPPSLSLVIQIFGVRRSWFSAILGSTSSFLVNVLIFPFHVVYEGSSLEGVSIESFATSSLEQEKVIISNRICIV